ncbi:UDP-N-acetylmuramate dehydrogenase [Candidatus Peregrinibacteria bacterium]|nr:UDP-N-acetylmuramate dehydrogenase [Candidatus Peregrinibacteria bacterium]
MELKVQQNVALSQFTTYRTGGPARFFSGARSWQEILGLREFAKLKGLPYLIIGGGSNVLFADEGYPGLVILNQMDKLQINGKNVTANSAVNLSKLVLLCAKHNLGGISGLALVPGSVGGAVYGNAGVPDVYISDVFMHAEILPEKSNKPLIVGPDYCKFAYRTSHFKKTKDIILSATFKLKPTPGAIIKTEINSYIKERTLKQPVGLTCGSFFKNPGQFPSAGWLIEQSGCKGMKVGGAQISEKHANWIMNTGKATTSDILSLAKQVYDRVDEKYSINLEPEVQIITDNPFLKT